METTKIPFQQWTILFSVIIIAFSFYVWRKMTYFRRYGVPHTQALPFVGHMLSVIRKKKHMFTMVHDLYKLWPDTKYFGMYDRMRPIIIVRDLELIKSITVKNFDHFMDHRDFFNAEIDPLLGKSLNGLRGNQWRETRTLLTPAFTGTKMKLMFELMLKCSKRFMSNLPNDKSVEYEMKDVFNKYAIDVIATCAFGLEVNSLQDPNNEFYQLAKNLMNFNNQSLFAFFIITSSPFLAKLLDLHILDPKLTSYFKDIVDQTIKYRMKEGIVRPDMLQLMIEAKENEAKGGMKMDLDDMCAQAFIFFFAGYDATSSLMSFATTSVAMNEQVQEKLHREIDQIANNGEIDYEILTYKTPYLEAVLYEALRLYSIGGIVDRICTKEFEFPPARPGLKPFVVKPGMNIWLAAIGIHNDPEHYPNPQVFDPDRFLDRKMNANQPDFLGFGVGPRSCIGNRFGLMECKLILFHLFMKYRIQVSDKLQVPLKLALIPFTLNLEGGFWLHLVPRELDTAK